MAETVIPETEFETALELAAASTRQTEPLALLALGSAPD